MRAGAAALANGFPGLYVAGAGVGGLGVPACIAQGNLIASTIADLGLSPREPVKGANQPQH
jgi:protoporphyrinogen oxidase